MHTLTDHPSVLLIHGVQSSRLTWWQIGDRLLDQGWSVSAVDLPGHGQRPFIDAEFATLDDLAADVGEQIGDTRFDLVIGHSLGALVALTLSIQRPDVAGAVIVEDPPGASERPHRTVEDIIAAVAAARTDPDGQVAQLLADNPRWQPTDARNAVISRASLDVDAVTRSLRGSSWDLPAMVAACPVPVHLIVADGPASALGDPDRTAIIDALPDGSVTVVASGHSIHRDDPARWLQAVTAVVQANG